jgi:hypothetical protein
VSDILNQKNIFLQDANLDGKLDVKTDNIIQEFQPGAVFSLGFSYDILRK